MATGENHEELVMWRTHRFITGSRVTRIGGTIKETGSSAK
jgi:hypothetical protein